MRIDHKIHEQLDLGELLTEQRRRRRVRQRSREFIKPEVEIVRQLHPVGPRFFSRLDHCLAQARLKLVRRKRRHWQHLRFQFLLQLVERCTIIRKVTFHLSVISLARKRIEMIEAISLSRRIVETRRRFFKRAFRSEKKIKSKQCSDREDDYKRAQPPIFAEPVHSNLSGLRKSSHSS